AVRERTRKPGRSPRAPTLLRRWGPKVPDSCGLRYRGLRGLLYARDEPRGLAVAGLAAHVPDLVERLRVRSVVLADEAPETHAGDLVAVLDHRLDDVGVDRDHLGLLRAAALLQLHRDLRVHLRRRVVADVVQVAAVVGGLKAD